MAKLLNPAEPVRFEPLDQRARKPGERVAYLLKVPTVYDRPALQRAVRAAGGREWNEAEQIAALKAGIHAILPGDEDAVARENLLAQVDALEANSRELGQDVMQGKYADADEGEAQEFLARLRANAEMRDELQPLLDSVEAGYPRLANMKADIEAYPLILGIEAARLLLVGWENVRHNDETLEFRRDRDGVPVELLGALRNSHLVAIGAEAIRLITPTETERKNSVSPSPGMSGRTPSTAKSTATSKTPSRTTSGRSPKSAGPSSASTPST